VGKTTRAERTRRKIAVLSVMTAARGYSQNEIAWLLVAAGVPWCRVDTPRVPGRHYRGAVGPGTKGLVRRLMGALVAEGYVAKKEFLGRAVYYRTRKRRPEPPSADPEPS
jgi:hypothetical protein